MTMAALKTRSGRIIQDPPIAVFLFNDTRFAPIWTIIRVLIGLTWVQSGWGKLNNPAWVETGEALRGFWERAVMIPDTGKPAIAFDWYRGFIQGMLDAGSYTWFAKLIAFGETMVGVALILGAFVGIAALFGALLNWNFIMAGTASSNALLGLGAVMLILAWKTAGYYGLDYYLLNKLGTPWQKRRDKAAEAETAQQFLPSGSGAD